jgi:sugar phosphate isomerase/epimerase
MVFGMPTLIETKSPADCAALCRELGLDFVELNMNFPQYQTDGIDVDEFAETAEKYGIFYTVHLDENLNPCDFNRRVAAAYTDAVLRTVGLAKRLSVPLLNMHLPVGVYFTLPNGKAFLFGEYEDEYLKKLTEFRDACAAAIGGSDIKICVENTGGYDRAPFLKKGLDLLLESPVFGLTFDIGHNYGVGGGDETIVAARRDRLNHMHVHDVCNKRDHLALGTGDLNLTRYLELAKERNCRCVIETKTIESLRQSVEWLNENFFGKD